MFDVSATAAPTMKTLYELVDLLASLKVNQLQLYTESIPSIYRGHEVVWKDATSRAKRSCCSTPIAVNG